MKKNIIFCLFITLSFYACGQSNQIKKTKAVDTLSSKWKHILKKEVYEIMVNKGTEAPFKNAFYNHHEKGVYVSAATGEPLFSSDDKFDSGTGWPSFSKPIHSNAISIVKDTSHGMLREEVVEKKTGLHLGHVFNDGPAPTGLRFCINSASLKFIKAD